MKKKVYVIAIIALFVCFCASVKCSASVEKYYITSTPKLTVKKGTKVKLLNYAGKKITWKSKDTSIAKINKKGIVTTNKVGTTKIISTNKKGKKYVCNLTVKNKVKKVTVDNVTIDVKSIKDDIVTFQVNNDSDQCIIIKRPAIKHLENGEWVGVTQKETTYVGPHIHISPQSSYKSTFALSNYEIETGTYAITYDNVRTSTKKFEKLDIVPLGIFTVE